MFLLLAFTVLSEEGIHVSRVTGDDTKACGKVSSPCRTIFYGIKQLSTGLYIYLDGTDTLNNPYTCEDLVLGYPGILLTKSVSFVGMISRAYISCLHGSPWVVNGSKFKDGIQISFSRLAFLNTSIRLFDALMTATDTVFADSKHVSLDIQVESLPRLWLSLNNVAFENNTVCVTIKSNGSKIFVNIINTVFYQNGYSSSSIPSTLWLTSQKSLINIQLRNCSLKNNVFKEYGMILVENKLGETHVSLNQLILNKNSQTNPSIKNGVFNFDCARVFLSLDHGYIFKTSSIFLTATGQSAEINISNVKVDGFYSAIPGGGVVDLFQSDYCSLSIQNSSFQNGNNRGTGGIVSIVATNSALTIQNSTIHNISSSSYGGAVYIVTLNKKAGLQSLNPSKSFFVVRIINSSFSYCSSGKIGGAVCVFGRRLLVIIRDSSFLRNSATIRGGALFFLAKDDITIRLHNNYFLENSADDGGIVEAMTRFKQSTFNVSISNVRLVGNKIRKLKRHYCGIINLTSLSRVTNIKIEDAHFTRNLAENSSCIAIFSVENGPHSVTLDTCIFRKNVGLGTVNIKGGALLTCKHSIFDSNNVVPCLFTVLGLELYNSSILIINTTFVNNFCSQLGVILTGNSVLRVYDSEFVRNNNLAGGTGGALLISSIINNFKSVQFERVIFKENIATTGSVMSLVRGEVRFTKCTFLNNFASVQGGQIVSGYWGMLGSGNLAIFHSIFEQTVSKITINKTKEYIATAFLKLLSPGKLISVNTTFQRNIKSYAEALILVPTANMIRFDNASLIFCPIASHMEKAYSKGKSRVTNRQMVTLTVSCLECGYNFYSLERGTARALNVDDSFQCLPCPQGADCVSAIRSKTNYWGYRASSNPPKLAFAICPFGYCKSPPNNSTEYNACQGKRTGVMCGMCSQGYTEAMWSTHCTSVKDCNDHWFWILLLAFVFSMAITLVFKPPFVTFFLKQTFWFRTSSPTVDSKAIHDSIPSSSIDEGEPLETTSWSSTEQLKQDKRQFTQLVEIIFYFYQMAKLLLFSTSLTEFFDHKFLAPVLGFFNFQPSLTKHDSLCPFPGLTPETKFVFKIVPVIGTLIAIFLIYALHSFTRRIKGAVRPAIGPYIQASIKTIFLGYVTLATVSISLIRCVFVSDESRWFYNGNITCYQWWQYTSFAFNAIFVIPFIFVLALVSFKLHCNKIAITFPLPFLILWLLRVACSCGVANVGENQNVNALKEMLLAPYKQPNSARKRGALYWQSVLIARRFILVLIFCMETELHIRLFCMTIVCVVVLCWHVKVRPFQNSLANNLESLSLFFLVILGLVNLFKSMFFGSEQNIKGSLATVLKVFQWLETVMLGIFPAVLLLLLSFALISFLVRVLLMCCRSIFKLLIKPCFQRLSQSAHSIPLLDGFDEIDDDMGRHFVN